MPRTYRLPGLGQETAILFLQALGQTLQVLQLLIYSLGKLQGLLGTVWGRGHVSHERGRQTTGEIHSETEATEKSRTETEGDGDPRERDRDSEKKKKRCVCGGRN